MQTLHTSVVPSLLGSRNRRWYPVLKRCFDLAFAALGCLVLAPVAAVIAAAIKLSDGGPVIYRQKRVGQYGRPFEILKFRTMVVDADKLGPSVTQGADPRITCVGRILRRTKLDELPQLWNVLKGEMSFVGPRPEVPRYVERYTPEQRQILQFKPGITDLATLTFREEEVLLRNAADVEEFYVSHCIPRKFKLNMEYAKQASLLEDFLLILETLFPYFAGVVCGYALILAWSLWLAYQLRFDFSVSVEESVNMKFLGLLVIPIQISCLLWRKQLRGLVSYFSTAELKQLAAGLSVAGGIQLLIWFITEGDWMPGRSIIVIHMLVSFVLLAGVRMTLRSLREGRAFRRSSLAEQPKVVRIGIIGAGELGAWVAEQINRDRKSGRRVEAFFDDNTEKWNKTLCAVPVVGMPECILNGFWAGKLDEVIVADPSRNTERLKEIQHILKRANIRSRTVPSLEEVLAR